MYNDFTHHYALYGQKAVFEGSEGSMFRGDLHYIKITHVIPTLRDTIF